MIIIEDDDGDDEKGGKWEPKDPRTMPMMIKATV